MIRSVHVAVGVIFNQQREVLIALRDPLQHQGGLWEFPGGKVEAEEKVEQALSRELLEEVHIDVIACSPLLKFAHDYGDKRVILDVWCIDEYSGEATGREGQQINWVKIDKLDNYDFPEANQAIIKAIRGSLENLPQE